MERINRATEFEEIHKLAIEFGTGVTNYSKIKFTEEALYAPSRITPAIISRKEARIGDIKNYLRDEAASRESTLDRLSITEGEESLEEIIDYGKYYHIIEATNRPYGLQYPFKLISVADKNSIFTGLRLLEFYFKRIIRNMPKKSIVISNVFVDFPKPEPESENERETNQYLKGKLRNQPKKINYKEYNHLEFKEKMRYQSRSHGRQNAEEDYESDSNPDWEEEFKYNRGSRKVDINTIEAAVDYRNKRPKRELRAGTKIIKEINLEDDSDKYSWEKDDT